MEQAWYAVQCRAQQDARAERELARQGYEVFRPKVRTRRAGRVRVSSFFPRYLFIQLGQAGSFAPVRSTRGVLKLVGWGGVTPPVPGVIVEGLRARCDADGCVRAAGARLKPGDKVRITDGPLYGLTGTLVACTAAERVLVLLSLLQREVRLCLSADLVEASV